MKQLLLTTIAAVVLVGCGESQQSTTPAETQPAETVAAATQPELPTDVSNRKLIKIFWFSYPYEPEPGYRMWERSDEGMWTENYPSGFKSMFEEVGRIKVDGLSGDYAVKVGGDSSKTQTVDGSFRVFIPDYSDTETFLYMSRKIGDDWGEWEKSNYLIKVMTTRDGLKHGTAHGAVVTRDVDGLRSLLNDGVNINAKDEDGKTPLDYANNEVAKILINHGARTSDELKAAQPDPPTAKAPAISIHDAATEGNIEAVRQHLAAGTDVNAKLGGRTSLHLAAYEGHKAIAALLISEGGNINAKSDVNGGTPLHAAAFGGRTEIVELLIANGADVNAKAVSGPKQGKTPLDAANETNHPETADLLRKHGGKTGAELKAEGK